MASRFDRFADVDTVTTTSRFERLADEDEKKTRIGPRGLPIMVDEEGEKRVADATNKTFDTLSSLMEIPQAALFDPPVNAIKQLKEMSSIVQDSYNVSTPEDEELIKQRWRDFQSEADHQKNRQAAASITLAAGGSRVGIQALLNKTLAPIIAKTGIASLPNAALPNLLRAGGNQAVKTAAAIGEGSIGLGAFNAMWEEEDGRKPDVLTGMAVGGGLGAGLSLTPPAVRIVGSKIALPVIKGGLWALGKLPVPQALKSFAASDHRSMQILENTLLVNGANQIKKAGAFDLADDLITGRNHYSRLSGGWTADIKKALDPLTPDEQILVGSILHRDVSLAKDAIGNFTHLAPLVPDRARQKLVISAASQLSRQLRFQGELLRLYGVGVRDANNRLSWFEPASDFGFPHMHPNPRNWIEGTKDVQEDAINAVLKPRLLKRVSLADGTVVKSRTQARKWLEEFIDGIEGETTRGTRVGSSNSQHMFARTMDLPGYEQNPSLVLPQYNDWVAKRIVHASKFGPIRDGLPSIPTRWETVKQFRQRALFGNGQTPEKLRAGTNLARAQRTAEVKAAAETRLAKEKRSLGLKDSEELVTTAAEKEAAILESGVPSAADPEKNIRKLYPRAYEGLDQISDLEQRALADKILSDELGKIPQANSWWYSLNKVASLNVLDKLTFSQIIQPTQIINAVAMTQWRGAFGGFLKAMRGDPEMWDFALRSGSINHSTVRAMHEQLLSAGRGPGSGGKIAEITGQRLNELGFTHLDVVSRVVSANQGRLFAETGARKYMQMVATRNPTTRQLASKEILKDRLSRIGIDPEEIIQNRGRLTQQQLERAGQEVSTQANFWSDALSLPHAFRTPQGRFFLQFKSFTAQQSDFIAKHIIGPAKRGDSGPWVKWMVGSQVVGEQVANLKAAIFGRERPPHGNPLRYLENTSQSAGLGIAFDAFMIASRGQGAAYGFVAGPTLSTVATELVQGVGTPAVTGTVKGIQSLTGDAEVDAAIRDYKRAARGAGKFATRRVLPMYSRWTALATPFIERKGLLGVLPEEESIQSSVFKAIGIAEEEKTQR